MIFTETQVAGVYVVEPERHADARGFFARTYDADELRAHGLNSDISQCSVSFNAAKHTLRGLHYQRPPHAEAKLVRCTMGAIYDVAVDLRPSSPSYCRWVAAELTAENRRMLYVPEGCAHGFLTLTDRSEVFYHISAPFHPAAGAGVRWDDPAFGIAWPHQPAVLSERDACYPDYVVHRTDVPAIAPPDTATGA
jgi:dTDP-4-dehydrorhamnose 3,5-epimerase